MNSTIYNSLDSTLKSQISSGRYYFRANPTSNWSYQYTAGNTYSYERNGSSYWSNGYADCNVALLNYSDYKYATLAASCSRNNTGSYNDSCGQNNWIGKMMYNNMGNGKFTWTINPPGYYYSNYWYSGAMIFYTNSSISSVYLSGWNNMSDMAYIFPVFYLKSQGYTSKGTGTSSNPYYFSL